MIHKICANFLAYLHLPLTVATKGRLNFLVMRRHNEFLPLVIYSSCPKKYCSILNNHCVISCMFHHKNALEDWHYK